MTNYDYSKLKGKIREVFGTQQKFADALEIANTTLSSKLNNIAPFTQLEIDKTCAIFNFKNGQDLKDYFFTSKVQ